MRTVYVEAYDDVGNQRLGNLDGQKSFIGVKDYKRTHHYKALHNGTMRAAKYITFWRIVDNKGKILETIHRR
jgi:hypothetical protein